MVTTLCLLIDLRKSKISIELEKSSIIIGNLNLLGWVVLKSDVSLSDELNKPLAKLCTVTQKGYWERLVDIYSNRRILFLQITMVIILKK